MKDTPLEEIHYWLVQYGIRRFSDIIDDIVRVEPLPGILVKIRVIIVDGSFLDIYWSPSGRYSLHYERRRIDGAIYRYDNAPHQKHRHIRTFPKHYHNGSESNVIESYLPDEPVRAVEEFLETIKKIVRDSLTHQTSKTNNGSKDLEYLIHDSNRTK